MSEDTTAPNPSTALARVVIDELARHRVGLACLAPGSRSAALGYALTESSIPLYVSLDERSAGFMALGASKAGMLGVAVTTSGTATANLFPAVVEADEAGVPLLVITADRPPEWRHSGANQTIDQVYLYGSKVRWFAALGPAADLPGESGQFRSAVSQAVAAAHGFYGRPGPVHLNLSFREPVVPAADDGRTSTTPYRGEVDGRAGGEPWTDWLASPPAPTALSLEGRTLFILGDGGTAHLAEEAMAAGAVVIAEAHSGARIPGTISTAHHFLAHPKVAARLRADLVVQVGRVGLSTHLANLIESVGQRVVVSDRVWADPSRRASNVRGPVRPVAGSTDPGWVAQWHEADSISRQALDEALDGEPVLDEPRIARDLAKLLPEGAALVVGSSMPVRDLDWFMAPRHGLTVISNRGASGIDGFVSTALGTAALHAGPVVALGGDLALLHDQNGWLIRPLPNLTMVVVNNDGGGIFSFLPQAGFPQHFEQLFATPTGRDLSHLARLYGLEHRLLTTAPELAAEISSSPDHSRLLELRTDRSANAARHRELTARVGKALAGW